MQEYLHPGIYKNEIPSLPPLEPLTTSIAGFVGTATKGPVGIPVLINNWEKFKEVYGGYSTNSLLAYAVRGFFENGGSKCYIVRTVHYDGTSKASTVATKDVMADTEKLFIVNALNDGAWGNKIEFEIVVPDGVPKVETFSIKVYYEGSQVEEFTELSLENAEEMVNGSSKYISLVAQALQKEVTLKSVSKTKLEGGKDGLESITDSDYLGSGEVACGLSTLKKYPVNFVAIPGETSQAIYAGMISFTESAKKCIAILDSPLSKSPDKMAEYVEKMNLNSSYAALYYPNVLVNDPIGVGKNTVKVVPPSGHIMGAIASYQEQFGVWKAPAGEKVNLKGILGTNFIVDAEDQDLLNPIHINALRAFPQKGYCIWGARTLAKGDYKYINARTLVLFIEQYIENNMLWTVFENNGETLWGSIRLNISTFLTDIWGKGGLRGKSVDEAFFIKCDGENNPDESIDKGITNVDIGLSIYKPAEFIIFNISHKKGGNN